MASPTPVLPLVGSTIVAPGLRAPRRSASSIMAAAMRSFTLAPGLRASILASTRAPAGSGNRRSRTSGVPPMSSRMVSAIFVLMRLYVVHRPRGPALFLGARDEVAQRPAIHDAGHRLADLLDRDQRPTPMRGEVEHGLDRVLPLGRDAHRDLSAGGCRARAGARRPWRST